eukprot:4054721-Amphidinium_carterae.1
MSQNGKPENGKPPFLKKIPLLYVLLFFPKHCLNIVRTAKQGKYKEAEMEHRLALQIQLNEEVREHQADRMHKSEVPPNKAPKGISHKGVQLRQKQSQYKQFSNYFGIS